MGNDASACFVDALDQSVCVVGVQGLEVDDFAVDAVLFCECGRLNELMTFLSVWTTLPQPMSVISLPSLTTLALCRSSS